MNSRLIMTGKVLVSALCMAVFGACSSDDTNDVIDNNPKMLSFSFQTRAASDDVTQVVPTTVSLFGFSGDKLYGKYTLNTTSGSASAPATDGNVLYFASGLTDVNIQEGGTLEQLLNATVSGPTKGQTASDFLTGMTTVPAGSTADKPINVELTHSTARFDLSVDGTSKTVIDSMRIDDVPASSYIFTSNNSRAALTGTATYYIPFSTPVTTGTQEGVSYAYETTGNVTVYLFGKQNNVPLTFKVTIPGLVRGRIYQIAVKEAGANVNVSFTVKDWEVQNPYNAEIAK